MKNIVAALVVGALLFGEAHTASSQPAVGDWLGTITITPDNVLNVAVHIHEAANGGYAGSYDNMDEALYDKPLADLVAAADRLSFSVPEIWASYAGTWNPARQQWVGDWSQGRRKHELALAAGIAPPRPIVPGLDGEWDGMLYFGHGLRYALHVATETRGTVATFDNVDAGIYAAPIASIERDGDGFRLAVRFSDGVISGEIVDDGKTFAGTVQSRGEALSIPLTLHRLPAGAASPWPMPARLHPFRGAPPHWSTPSDDEIRKLLTGRIDGERAGIGIVVGVIDAGGRRVVSYGRSDPADGRALDGDSEFEIGSITKAFTALLMADMVEHGDVALDDPAGKYLPAGVTMPERDGKPITLVDLATHTSGLPRLPANFAPRDAANPFADYGTDQLFQFLASYRLPRVPGAQWEYSNLGSGLLGHLLARRANMDYEALVKARILEPLGMTSTAIVLDPEQAARLARGHDDRLVAVPNWDFSSLAGAGALRSTANDLLTFLAAILGYMETPLKPAMESMLMVQRPTGTPSYAQALGWDVTEGASGKIISKTGLTGGYHSYVGFDPETRVGVVVLTNAATVAGSDDIARHILLGLPVTVFLPPLPPPPTRHAMALPPGSLQRYVGDYRLTPQVAIAVTREDHHLFARLTGQERYEIFPETPTDFFWRIVDAQASFDLDPDGRVLALVLHQYGRDRYAPRIVDTAP